MSHQMDGEVISSSDTITVKAEDGEIVEDIALKTSTNVNDKENGITSSPPQKTRPEDPLPEELKVLFEPLNCKLCKVSVSSTVTAYTHYQGKGHKRKIDQYLRENHGVSPVGPAKKRKKEFVATTCEICDVELTSELQALQHMSGKSHLKRKLSNRIKPVKVPEAKPDPTGRFGIGVSFLQEGACKHDEVIPEPERKDFFCEICKVTMNSEASYKSHLIGSKHIKKSKLEDTVDSNLLSKYRTPSNSFYCNSCDVLCNSGEQFMGHLSSKKHLKLKH